MLVQRSVVQCQVGETKQKVRVVPGQSIRASQRACRNLRARSAWRDAGDWVFANDAGRPRWQETILQRHWAEGFSVIRRNWLKMMVARDGVEPPTPAFSVLRYAVI